VAAFRGELDRSGVVSDRTVVVVSVGGREL
jgi:hypothetical protein